MIYMYPIQFNRWYYHSTHNSVHRCKIAKHFEGSIINLIWLLVLLAVVDSQQLVGQEGLSSVGGNGARVAVDGNGSIGWAASRRGCMWPATLVASMVAANTFVNSLTATIWGYGYKFVVIWRRYPGPRLEHYLQNIAVIQMHGFTHRPSV